jgi:hypothetical protein
MPPQHISLRDLSPIELERASLRETRARTLRDLLLAQDEAATLLATMYEIGGMAVVG